VNIDLKVCGSRTVVKGEIIGEEFGSDIGDSGEVKEDETVEVAKV
jgi:hypothetical protein